MSDVLVDQDGEEEEAAYPPWNFSWVVPDQLAAMSWPQHAAHLRYLQQHNVGHLVTLSPERLPPGLSAFPRLEWTLVPVREFDAPSVRDVLRFLEVCGRARLSGRAVAVHCRMGRGRTGVMAACYLVRFLGMAPERAVLEVRMQRPGSVETPEQERAVLRYHDCLRRLTPERPQAGLEGRRGESAAGAGESVGSISAR